ncbi:MAG: hypothetical protein JSS66_14975 [Armatimonadetes bacterium]|nr:hypothetical protein [Armatimonadota bacterium]
MSDQIIVSLIGLAGTLLLAFVATLNLVTSRQLLIRVSRQLEISENQSEMTLIRNAFVEMSEFLQIFVEKPHLRPYFYDGAAIPTGDSHLDGEVAALAEWILTNFATGISLAVMLPEYPIGALKETIRYHLRNSPAMRTHLEDRYEGFPVTGLTLLRWTYDTKQETIAALERLLGKAESEGREELAARIRMQIQRITAASEETDLLYASAGLANSRAGAIVGST